MSWSVTYRPNSMLLFLSGGRDGAVELGTCFGLQGPEFEPRPRNLLISTPVHISPAVHPALKLPRRGDDLPARSRVKVKKE